MGSAGQSNGEHENQVKTGVQADWDRQRTMPRMMVAGRVCKDRSLEGAFFLFNSDLCQLHRMAEPQTGTGTYVRTQVCVDLERENSAGFCRNVQ